MVKANEKRGGLPILWVNGLDLQVLFSNEHLIHCKLMNERFVNLGL